VPVGLPSPVLLPDDLEADICVSPTHDGLKAVLYAPDICVVQRTVGLNGECHEQEQGAVEMMTCKVAGHGGGLLPRPPSSTVERAGV
jgi:hypothetical protein